MLDKQNRRSGNMIALSGAQDTDVLICKMAFWETDVMTHPYNRYSETSYLSIKAPFHEIINRRRNSHQNKYAIRRSLLS
jgi:hypothetical protein